MATIIIIYNGHGDMVQIVDINGDVVTSVEIQNGEDMIGYQYLHGTNTDVGRFAIKGTIS